MISDKIRPHHLQRKALLYVRQSSAHQVLHNRESSALQYAMRDRLIARGWSEVEMIDDNLGRSAAGSVQRAGFERIVAQVCLGKVGAVAAREVSRFARNSRDWQQLIEMCRVVDTVMIDQETIYAPRHGKDRLLLGLKSSLNEYELDLLRQPSLAARYRIPIAACRRPSAWSSIRCWSSAVRGRPPADEAGRHPGRSLDPRLAHSGRRGQHHPSIKRSPYSARQEDIRSRWLATGPRRSPRSVTVSSTSCSWTCRCRRGTGLPPRARCAHSIGRRLDLPRRSSRSR